MALSGSLQRLRQYSKNTGLFWRAITIASLAIATLASFLQRPQLLLQPRGWLILALSGLYVSWYSLGSRWMVHGNEDDYWRKRLSGVSVGLHLRAIFVWGGLLAITLALVALDANFRWALYAVYGLSITTVSMPLALVLAVPTALAIFAVYGWLPHDASPGQFLNFGGNVLTFVIFSALAYFPIVLLRSRFARERMYQDLERSHCELEQAHHQLAESAERDRELAVLRERGRLARDMHDTLGHSLALIAVKLEAAQRLRSVDADRAEHEIAATKMIARESLAQLRATIADLRAPLLVHQPLGEALAQAAHEAAARVGWQVRCEASGEIGTLSDLAHEALLRVGMEALANAERHARARTLTLYIAREGREGVVRVADDGVGILATNPPVAASAPALSPLADGEPEWASVAVSEAAVEDTVDGAQGAQGAVGDTSGDPNRGAGVALLTICSPEGHFGITGMRERIAAVHGVFSIGAHSDGLGTVVEARVPIAEL
jgi:signal transduction histidine kinase